MTEPQAEWAKQILQSPHAFKNVLVANHHEITPRAFFFRRSPPFSELKKMLSEMTYETVFLPDQQTQTFTHIAGRTHRSEPFEYSVVTEKEMQDARLYGDNVTPVQQEQIDWDKEQKIRDLQRLDENPRGNEQNGNTTIPGEPIEIGEDEKTREPAQPAQSMKLIGPPSINEITETIETSQFPIKIDLTHLEKNIPSLADPKIGDSFVTQPSTEPSSLFIDESLYDPPHLEIPSSEPKTDQSTGSMSTPVVPNRDQQDPDGPILTSYIDHLDGLPDPAESRSPLLSTHARDNSVNVETAVFGSMLHSVSSVDLSGAQSSPSPAPSLLRAVSTSLADTPAEAPNSPKSVIHPPKMSAHPPSVPTQPKPDFGGIQLKSDRLGSHEN